MRKQVGSHHYILKVGFGLDGKRDDGQKTQDDKDLLTKTEVVYSNVELKEGSHSQDIQRITNL